MRTLLVSITLFVVFWVVGYASRPKQIAMRLPVADLTTPTAQASDKPLPVKRQAENIDPFTAWLKPGNSEPARAELLIKMSNSDPARAWTVFIQSGGSSLLEMENIATAWGKVDGPQAAATGMALTNPIQRSAFLSKALTSWAQVSVTGLLAWIKRQPPELGLEAYVDVSMLGRDDQKKQVTLAELNAAILFPRRGSSDYHPLQHLLSRAWQNEENRQQAPAWIEAQTDQEVQDVAWLALAKTVVTTDLSKAESYARNILDPSMATAITSEIAAKLTHQNPQQALEFTKRLPDQGAARKAWASVMGTWATREPVGAMRHILSNPDSFDPDDLYPSISPWAASIPKEVITAFGPDKRLAKQAEYVARDWLKLRPLEAKKWLEQNGAAYLGNEHMEKVLKKKETSSSGYYDMHTVGGRQFYYRRHY
jgi:hypothetical protein